MMYWWALPILIGGALAGSQSKDAIAPSCSKFCEQTYEPHTLDQSGGVKACNQGCRMYSLVEFTTSRNVTEVQAACSKTCDEAYKDKALREACEMGCRHQAPFQKTGHTSFTMDSSDPMYPYAQNFLSKVFDQFDSFHRGMMGMPSRMMQQMRNWMSGGDKPLSTDNFFGVDLDKQFERMEKEMDEFMAQNHMGMGMGGHHMGRGMGPMHGHHMMDWYPDSDESEENDAEETLKPPNPLHVYGQSLTQDKTGKPQKVDNLNAQGEPVLHVQMIPGRYLGHEGRVEFGTVSQLMEKPHEPSPPVGDVRDTAVPEDTWLSYLAHRTGNLSRMTRWLLFLALVFCLLSMIWICLALMKTVAGNRQRRRWAMLAKLDADQLKDPMKAGSLTTVSVQSMAAESDKAALVHCEMPVGQSEPPPAYQETEAPAIHKPKPEHHTDE